jgi:hypothetical protein
MFVFLCSLIGLADAAQPSTLSEIAARKLREQVQPTVQSYTVDGKVATVASWTMPLVCEGASSPQSRVVLVHTVFVRDDTVGLVVVIRDEEGSSLYLYDAGLRDRVTQVMSNDRGLRLRATRGQRELYTRAMVCFLQD